MTKHPQDIVSATAARDAAGAPATILISEADLASAIRAELEEFFHDGVSPTLGEYAVGHIVGGIIQRVGPGEEGALVRLGALRRLPVPLAPVVVTEFDPTKLRQFP